MCFKKSFLLSLLFFISCSTTYIEDEANSNKMIGKFSMFSENNCISGKISIFNQKEISQIKINLDRYPKTFLVTEFREGNQKKIDSNFNEWSNEQETYENYEVLSINERGSISCRWRCWDCSIILCSYSCKYLCSRNVIKKVSIY